MWCDMASAFHEMHTPACHTPPPNDHCTHLRLACERRPFGKLRDDRRHLNQGLCRPTCRPAYRRHLGQPQASRSVNRDRPSSFLKSRSKLTRCSPSCSTAAASQASGRSLPPSCLSRQSCLSLCHSGPSGANRTPGMFSMASMKSTACVMGVGCMKILGLVTNRRALATYIGIKVKDPPVGTAAKAPSSHARATAWCG